MSGDGEDHAAAAPREQMETVTTRLRYLKAAGLEMRPVAMSPPHLLRTWTPHTAPGATANRRLKEGQRSRFITAPVCFGLWEDGEEEEEERMAVAGRACDSAREPRWERCLFVVPVFSLTVPLAVHAVPRPTTGAILIDRRMRGGHILFAAAC